ncbi:MAG: aminopeptidase [Clostridia bacterium]
MKDERLFKLANTLLKHSLGLERGDIFEISAHFAAKPLVKAIVEEANKIGARPNVIFDDPEVSRLVLDGIDLNDEVLSRDYYKKVSSWGIKRYNDIKAVIFISALENDSEMSNIDRKKLCLRNEERKTFNDILINERKWVSLDYPTMAQAQKAKMSYDDFYDFCMDVCLVDYKHMANCFVPLKALMERTDRVHILGNGTDLSFSIKGIPVIPCSGECNIPDGEIFTAPIRDSVNGVLQYNTETGMHGHTFKNVRFEFKDGKIIKASCDGNNDALNSILDSDAGARYIGEFALGVNNLITKPFGNTLFDEKIGGSFHFTPGEAYAESDNGNKSIIHWDIVCIQTPEHGGGEIYFDDVLVRKNGLFVINELKGLNP